MNVNSKIAISDNGFIFDPVTGDSYSINTIGSEIINLIKREVSVPDIKTVLYEKYDVSRPVLERSVDDFIETMINLKILNND